MKALVIGSNGMDGSHMCDLLLSKGYEVWGTYRKNKDHISKYVMNANFHYVKLDLENIEYFFPTIAEIAPDEIYNFAGVSFSPDSERFPKLCEKINYASVMRLMESALALDCKFFQASSSEVFGKVSDLEINESTERKPHTPYADAKNEVDRWLKYYRGEGAKFYTAISFNHESERRGEKFVTRKITRSLAQIVNNQRSRLIMGNLDSRRDWGYAPDYVEGFYKMVQSHPDEYILATGTTHSVRDILDICGNYLGIDWQDYVIIEPTLQRVGERNNIWGNASKIKQNLGWSPTTSFEDMIIKMLKYDLEYV